MKKIISFILFAILMVGISDITIASNKKKQDKQEEVKPIIGVSSTAQTGVAAASLTYIKSIKRAGGVPLVIPMTNDPKQIEAILNVVDAVVMTGGEDVDPLKYYGEEPLRALGEVVPERDEFDCLLIKMAVEKGLPVLGICRGEQMMNVAFGGTLYQDIPSQVPSSYIKHRQNVPSRYGSHTINIEKGSLLEKMIGKREAVVNTFHHQAVKDVAPGFKVMAYSKDGIVEGIEKKGTDKVWGVQFHPEGFVSSGDDTFLGIFKHLIEKAKEK